ncbi:NAD(P)H-hydrate dehydratase [Pararhodonellum marinum]|uniref:NAD(P)H-hydrate dehydratase n=1 Tax=Pararhodonellum marinum TaxID=2755358 RepID=UPI00188E7E88|nr:NAD(P)H-hydrate dehydratase [Pararhodonellum marinum]
MINVIKGSAVKELDAKHILKHEISSWDLMEKAAQAFVHWYVGLFDPSLSTAIFCGTGNNGGDGLAIGRILHRQGYRVLICLVGDPTQGSSDFKSNLKRLPADLSVLEFKPGDKLAHLQSEVLIDALFGVGLNRPLEGKYKELVEALNQASGKRIAIDLPSGLPSDGVGFGTAVKADYTLTFQFPKLALLIPENAPFSGKVVVQDIGIDPILMEEFSSGRYFLEEKDVPSLHREFSRFSHKGDFGKVLLVGGSQGKIGAVYLAGKAALKTGSGLVSALVPVCGLNVLQSSCPEMMVICSQGKAALKGDIPIRIQEFDAVGIGPGMGLSESSSNFLKKILLSGVKHLVIDADGLNHLAHKPSLLELLPPHAVLTPHLKEFDRLVGKCKDHIERLAKAKNFAAKYDCYLVLKGANTVITSPAGKQWFNSTGTHYMATAGAGDVLTGMLTSFLGQGYGAEKAALCGVYHHGLAGELAGEQNRRGTMATDILDRIPQTFTQLNIL